MRTDGQSPARKPTRICAIGEALLPRDSEFTLIFGGLVYLFTLFVAIFGRGGPEAYVDPAMCAVAWASATISSLLFWNGFVGWFLRFVGICLIFAPPVVVTLTLAFLRQRAD